MVRQVAALSVQLDGSAKRPTAASGLQLCTCGAGAASRRACALANPDIYRKVLIELSFAWPVRDWPMGLEAASARACGPCSDTCPPSYPHTRWIAAETAGSSSTCATNPRMRQGCGCRFRFCTAGVLRDGPRPIPERSSPVNRKALIFRCFVLLVKGCPVGPEAAPHKACRPASAPCPPTYPQSSWIAAKRLSSRGLAAVGMGEHGVRAGPPATRPRPWCGVPEVPTTISASVAPMLLGVAVALLQLPSRALPRDHIHRKSIGVETRRRADAGQILRDRSRHGLRTRVRAGVPNLSTGLSTAALHNFAPRGLLHNVTCSSSASARRLACVCVGAQVIDSYHSVWAAQSLARALDRPVPQGDPAPIQGLSTQLSTLRVEKPGLSCRAPEWR